MLASDIITPVRSTLFDPAPGMGWSNADLIGFLNEAQSATSFVKPDAYTIQTFVGLAVGELQALPAGGIALLDITRNSDANGGRVVTQVDMSLLEEASRFWPRGTRQAEVEHFTADPRNPRRFQVFPPNNGAGSVEILYGAVPAVVTALTDTLLFPDSYKEPLIAFTLSRAFDVNSKRKDPAASARCMAQWGQLLGVKSKAQVAVAPRVAESPGLA